jgi:hypothetical protein
MSVYWVKLSPASRPSESIAKRRASSTSPSLPRVAASTPPATTISAIARRRPRMRASS